MDFIVIDFETAPITSRPTYPPEPVGVAIKWPGRPSTYHAWGHPTGNTCKVENGRKHLYKAWDSGLPLVFHNAKFDLAVAYERMHMPTLPWERVHDTMFQAYLLDPHCGDNTLKGLAEKQLHWPPEEKDEVARWVWDHRETLEQVYGARMTAMGLKSAVGGTHAKGASKPGQWIFACPGELVGRYAIGDVERTAALFNVFHGDIVRRNLWEAYNRERQLMPILMRNEREGMRVDMDLLADDISQYRNALFTVETSLRQVLHTPTLNLDSNKDLARALYDRGMVIPERWTLTAKDKVSMAKDVLLPECFVDGIGRQVASALGYRNRLTTCLNTFMVPWFKQAKANNGYITTNWNQTRGQEYGGTRTGRPSTSNHNFLNISKEFPQGKEDQYVHPDFLGVPQLPLCRRYVLPEEGQEFLHRDFSGQELRIFAHFEQGELYDAYHANPALDPHAFIGEALMAVAKRDIPRTPVKVMNFQSLYGGGVPALQRKLRCTYDEAKELKEFHNQALPGRLVLVDEIKKCIKAHGAIKTWGGRLYSPEPAGEDGRDKMYKLINYLIQGSAADITKQAIIDWDSVRHRDAKFLVSVYDEIDISGVYERDMPVLKEVMEADRLSVPMLSDGKRGPNWADVVKCL